MAELVDAKGKLPSGSQPGVGANPTFGSIIKGYIMFGSSRIVERFDDGSYRLANKKRVEYEYQYKHGIKFDYEQPLSEYIKNLILLLENLPDKNKDNAFINFSVDPEDQGVYATFWFWEFETDDVMNARILREKEQKNKDQEERLKRRKELYLELKKEFDK